MKPCSATSGDVFCTTSLLTGIFLCVIGILGFWANVGSLLGSWINRQKSYRHDRSESNSSGHVKRKNKALISDCILNMIKVCELMVSLTCAILPLLWQFHWRKLVSNENLILFLIWYNYFFHISGYFWITIGILYGITMIRFPLLVVKRSTYYYMLLLWLLYTTVIPLIYPIFVYMKYLRLPTFRDDTASRLKTSRYNPYLLLTFFWNYIFSPLGLLLIVIAVVAGSYYIYLHCSRKHRFNEVLAKKVRLILRVGFVSTLTLLPHLTCTLLPYESLDRNVVVVDVLFYLSHLIIACILLFHAIAIPSYIKQMCHF